jgi:hypothetical protein
MLERLYDFVEAGIEAEPEFVKAVKESEPDIEEGHDGSDVCALLRERGQTA